MKKDKIGIIFCLYNCQDTLNKCLNAWKQVKNEFFVYYYVSAPFEGYEDLKIEKDKTADLVSESGIMDFGFTTDRYIKETEARNKGLEYLKEQNCDIIWQVDGDEEYTVDQINNIINYINKNQDTAWFKLSLKNYIFDGKTYLEQPFCPPRIYRVNFPPYKLDEFYQDNNISYVNNNNVSFPDSFVRNKTIPKEITWINHYTWPSNETSKNKVLYQIKRWGLCSYRWNDMENKLEFNPDYYRNKELPKVIAEN